MCAQELSSPPLLEQSELTLFNGEPNELDAVAIILPMIQPTEPIIIPMIETDEFLALQAENLARREQIEAEYAVVIPDHDFTSPQEEATWLKAVHHVLWWTMLHSPIDGCWQFSGIVTLPLDKLNAFLEARRAHIRAMDTVADIL